MEIDSLIMSQQATTDSALAFEKRMEKKPKFFVRIFQLT